MTSANGSAINIAATIVAIAYGRLVLYSDADKFEALLWEFPTETDYIMVLPLRGGLTVTFSVKSKFSDKP